MACVSSRSERRCEYRTLDSTPDEVRHLLADFRGATVVVEACANAGGVSDLSGTADRKGRITRRGPALLRKLLVECGWAMLRYNRWARDLYARLTGGGANRKKPAIVAVARQLPVRCWAMPKSGERWREPAAAAGGATT